MTEVALGAGTAAAPRSAPLSALAQRALQRAWTPVDPAALAAFRVALGLIGLVSCLRFQAYGWVDELFVAPRFFFHYWGFAWVKPLPAAQMGLVFPALTVASACVTLGLFYRPAIVAFFVGFSYLQLVDVTNYLNHYYLVALLSGLLCLSPAHATGSLDALLFPRVRRASIPQGVMDLLRLQVGVVYFFAGLAKVNPEWLLHAQPLNIWLSSRTGMPIVGPLLAHPWAPWVASFAGCLFDLSIPFVLLHPRTRAVGYVAVVAFHLATGSLFPIGMFPFIMVAAALAFFSPSWPRTALATLAALARRERPAPREATLPSLGPRPAWLGPVVALGAIYAAFQVLFPLRAHLYGGPVQWHEQGMRWSWRVMLREKNGTVTYHVRDPETGRAWEVSPRRLLTDRQVRDFATQPDLILQLAHHVARVEGEKLGRPVEVRAETLVSWNGRRGAPLLDPTVDLTKVTDGLSSKPWILPAPEGPPPRLRALPCDSSQRSSSR